MSKSPRDNTNSVKVRFAPSPTGYLHIGGARTALFNWLYAKAKGGKFVLRIEDTDRKRNNPDAIAAILDGLKWLELDWDGEVVSQFSRSERHSEVAAALLESGHAYRCFLTADDLKDMREKAEAAKEPFRVKSPWRDRDPSEAPTDLASVIRLRAPIEGVTVIDDQVQGAVEFANKDLDDLVLARSDGTATYNLAVVVDDHDMGITHVVRGVDHLSNAARQSLIYAGMGWQVPSWAHVPLIHGPDGAKLSKRHGALGVEAYREMGYLPAAVRNYLVRLGWSHGDDEVFSTQQMIEWFDLDGIGKSAARFDFAKLESLNGHYIRTTPDEELVSRIEDLLPLVEGGEEIAGKLKAGARGLLLASMPGLKERAKTLVELIESANYLFALRPLALDKKAVKLLGDEGRAALGGLVPRFESVRDWTADAIECEVRAQADASALKLGKVAQPLRAALTGTNVSPPIFEVMEILGRQEVLARINDQV